jgi:peptidoglycan/LPS O-acetylase OafA/YrhL
LLLEKAVLTAPPEIPLKPESNAAVSKQSIQKRDVRYFPALTGLRFVLALWVILHHLTGKGMMLEEWARQLLPAAQSLLRGGYLAVQTFFVLSGFVLAQSYGSTPWSRRNLIRYGAARFARIYPVYLLSLVVASRFVIESLSKPGRSGAQKMALLGNYGFILQGWTRPLSVGWNTPAWSLSCEFFFYLCFPLLILWFRRGGKWNPGVALGISFVAPLLLEYAGLPAIWRPVRHLSDFLAGIAAASLYNAVSGSQADLRQRGFWLYLPAIAAGAAVIVHPDWLRGIGIELNTALRPANVVLLIGLALGGGVGAQALSTEAAGYLGKASYSMYILHIPLLWWYSRYAFHRLGTPPHIGTALVYLGFVITLSIAAFEFVESPANKWIRDFILKPELRTCPR